MMDSCSVWVRVEYSPDMEDYALEEKRIAESYSICVVSCRVDGRRHYVVHSDWGSFSTVSHVINRLVYS